MATRASTKVSINSINYPIPLGPLSIQFYRCQGGTVGDTVTITAADAGGRLIASALSGQAETTLSTSGATSVVLTLTASTADTNSTFDAILFVLP